MSRVIGYTNGDMAPAGPIGGNTLIHSFISEVIHQPFGHAIHKIGLPDFPKQTFLLEMGQILCDADGTVADDHKTLVKLWRSLQRGEIIATNVWDDAPLFYVRVGFGSAGLVIRLIHKTTEWHVESVISVYHRPLADYRLWRRASLAAVVILAAGLGFGLPKLAATAEHLHLVTGALQRLTTPVTASTGSTTPTSAHSATGDIGASTTQLTTTLAGSASSASRHVTMPVRHTWSFALEQGMPLFDLAQFLANHRLVPNATNFDMAMTQNGMDSDVQPGTYRFHSGMSQAALLQDIKNGPVS